MKKIDKNTKIRLRNYALLAGSAIAANTTDAQIVYTDISPDTLLPIGNSYQLDLNNDAVIDFVIGVQAINASSSNINVIGNAAGVITEGANEIMATMGTVFAVPYINALNNNDLINNTQNFIAAPFNSSSGIPALLRFSGTVDLGFGPIPQNLGNFQGNNQRFAGLKFSIGTNTHYGWVRLSVPSNATTITIYDYAYNSQPNQGINAGAVNVNELEMNQIVAMNYAYGNINISVLGINNLHNGKVTVVNMAGQEVLSTPITNTNNVISASNLSDGVYVINVSFDEGVYTNKLFINK